MKKLALYTIGLSASQYCELPRWVELAALPNRSHASVTAAVRGCQVRLPFRLLGLASDNGAEFINADLKRYCEQEHITFTRSRPHKKNDRACKVLA